MTRYATPLQFLAAIGAAGNVPSRGVGETPAKEDVGAGTGSAITLYLDQEGIIRDTETLYYGASETAAVSPLTIATHYTIDYDTGAVTLTAAGATLVSTNHIYAKYKYNTLGVSETLVEEILDRASQFIDDVTETTFTDGTVANPAFPVKTDELTSRFPTEQRYYTTIRPLVDITSALASGITTTSTNLTLTSGTGSDFPTSGTIVIDTEKITYTGVTTDTLTGLTRGVGDSDAATHDSGAVVHTAVVEASSSPQGQAPTFQVMQHESQVKVSDLGVITLMDNTLWPQGNYVEAVPATPWTPDRVRVTYHYGYQTIPTPIKRLAILYAKRMLIADNIGGSMIKGRDEFRPEMFDVDNREIQSILNIYRQIRMTNV